jgi:hypothetical protein
MISYMAPVKRFVKLVEFAAFVVVAPIKHPEFSRNDGGALVLGAIPAPWQNNWLDPGDQYAEITWGNLPPVDVPFRFPDVSAVPPINIQLRLVPMLPENSVSWFGRVPGYEFNDNTARGAEPSGVETTNNVTGEFEERDSGQYRAAVFGPEKFTNVR